MAKFFTPTRLSENIRETPEGFLLCLDVPIARTGWQEYGQGETPLEVGDDGRVWVYRDPKEVFRPQTIASFQAKSITIKHPDDFVTPDNWKELTFGVAQNIRRGEEEDDDGEEMLLADLLITDDVAIGLVKNGLREVSCGYDADYEQTGKGEGKQYNLIGNHIALVEQGRAGSAYAIKDHKGKGSFMTLKELADKIKNLGRTVDEAVAAEETEGKRAAGLAKAKKKGKTADSDEEAEQPSYDELVKAVKDLSDKIDGMKKPADEEEEKKEEKPADEEGEEEKSEDDEENEAEGETLARVKALEAAVAKILKSMGSSDEEEEESEDADKEDSDMSGDEDETESKDEEGEEGEESQKKKTGDEARFEILTPGQKFTGKDARVKCLKVFAKTEDGAKVLKQLGMSKPVFDSKTNVGMIFMAASAIVKSKRGTGLTGTKDGSKWELGDNKNEPMTADKLNELNAKHYGVAK